MAVCGVAQHFWTRIPQEPFQRTGLGQLFLEPASTDLARQQQPRGLPAPRQEAAPRAGDRFPPPLDGIFSAVFANAPSLWRSSEAQRCAPGTDRASPRPEWGPMDPFSGLRACRPPLVPQLRARAQRLVPPPRLPPPLPDPAPSGSMPRLMERAGEETRG